MRIWGFTAAAALCAGLTLSSAQVQQPKVKTPAPKTPKSAPKAAADQNPPEPTISVDITRVNILFTVTDKKGRFITDPKTKSSRAFSSSRPNLTCRSASPF